VAIIGDRGIGGSALDWSFYFGKYYDQAPPLISPRDPHPFPVDGAQYIVTAIRTGLGSPYSELMEKLAASSSEVALMIFAVDDRDTLKKAEENAKTIRKYVKQDYPVLLVGTKGDLRSNGGADGLISAEEANELAEKIGAIKYIETSAKEMKNLDVVFSEAVRAAVKFRSIKKSKKKAV
ncbi:P-loop containing nucleoside triphosphate hydrolase protein, partial [Ramicandelaber brevisporus]